MDEQQFVYRMKAMSRFYDKVEQWRYKYKNDYYESKLPNEKIAIGRYGVAEYGHKIWRLYYSPLYKEFKKLFKCNDRFAFARIEDFECIENFNNAYRDNFKGWIIHHRAETYKANGDYKDNTSSASLMKSNRYYNRPAEELIFLRADEHMKLHQYSIKYCSK